MATPPRQRCFILGSGRSMLELTDAEKAYLNAHPNTLAMNKYLMFWRKVGVAPKASFLADTHYPAHRVLLECLRAARRIRPRPHFYLQRDYQRLFRLPRTREDYEWWRKERAKVAQQAGHRLPLWLHYRPVSWFHSSPFSNLRPFFWSSSLEEELYFVRGSLTTCINLAAIIFPGTDVYLVGVDLDSPRSFFDEEYQQLTYLHDTRWDRMAQAAGRHFTAIQYSDKVGPIQLAFPNMSRRLAQDGRRLLCCNPRSLLVLEGVCAYEPILPAAAAASPAPALRPQQPTP